MTSMTRPRRHLVPAIVAAAVVLLTGCAGSTGTGAGIGGPAGEPAAEPTVVATTEDPFACGIGVSSTAPVLGDTLLIGRAPAPECLSLLPGSTHTLWLQPLIYTPETLPS